MIEGKSTRWIVLVACVLTTMMAGAVAFSRNRMAAESAPAKPTLTLQPHIPLNSSPAEPTFHTCDAPPEQTQFKKLRDETCRTFEFGPDFVFEKNKKTIAAMHEFHDWVLLV